MILYKNNFFKQKIEKNTYDDNILNMCLRFSSYLGRGEGGICHRSDLFVIFSFTTQQFCFKLFEFVHNLLLQTF